MINKTDLYPPEDRDKIIEDHYNAKERILEIIINKGATYPNEIIQLTGMQPTTVYNNLGYLAAQNKIKRIKLKSKEKIPPIIKQRFKELWARDIKGDMLFRISFYILPNRSLEDFKKDMILEMD